MSAVLFVCPVDGCGFRGFDEPPTTRIVCRHHQQRLVQDELYMAGDAADFRFRQVASIDERGNAKVVPKDSLANDPDAVKKAALREEYFQLTGEKADRRWNLHKLETNVEIEKKERATNG